MPIYKFKELIPAGVHLGHSVKNTLFHSAWMLITIRSGVAIINLFKTILHFKAAFMVFSNTVSCLGPIWFIDLNIYVSQLTRTAALRCGEFAAVRPWINGAVSNFPMVSKLFSYIYSSNASTISNKLNKLRGFFKDWHLTRHSWPRAVFLPSVHYSYNAAIEATKAAVPNFGIVDTDTLSQVLAGPIPGNDESVICLIIYQDMVANFILLKKFLLVVLWFFNIRVYKRPLDFVNWITSKYKLTENKNLKILSLSNVTNFNFDRFSNFKKGFSLYFSRNHSFNTFFEYIDIQDVQSNVDLSSKIIVFTKMRRKFLSVLKFYSFLKKISKKTFINRRPFKTRKFPRFFLRPTFYLSRFLTGRGKMSYTSILYKNIFWRKLRKLGGKRGKRRPIWLSIFFRLIISLIFASCRKYWSSSFLSYYRRSRGRYTKWYRFKTKKLFDKVKPKLYGHFFKYFYTFSKIKGLSQVAKYKFSIPKAAAKQKIINVINRRNYFFKTSNLNSFKFHFVDHKFDSFVNKKLFWTISSYNKNFLLTKKAKIKNVYFILTKPLKKSYRNFIKSKSKVTAVAFWNWSKYRIKNLRRKVKNLRLKYALKNKYRRFTKSLFNNNYVSKNKYRSLKQSRLEKINKI